MSIQRAVVKGSIASLVQIRHVFTADLVEGGSDTYLSMWQIYLNILFTEVCQMLSGQVVYTDFETYIPVAGQWVLLNQSVMAASGAEGGDYLPNAVAAVLLGVAAGSRHVGRKFFSGIAETFTANNVLTGAAVGFAAQSLIDYITPYNGIFGGTMTPGTVDKTGTFHPFVGGIVSSLLGSMRRRKPGVGI